MAAALIVPLVVGALLNLDRRAFLNCMIGRPLSAGAIMGMATGLPAEGVSLGLWSELLWFWTIPVGGFHTPNPGLAVSCMVLSLAALGRLDAFGHPASLAALTALAYALVPACAFLFILPDKLLRRLSDRISRKLEREVEAGGDPSFLAASLKGVAETFVLGLLFLAAASAAATLLMLWLSQALPAGVWTNLEKFQPYAPLVAFLGIAASLSRGSMPVYLLGLGAGLILALAIRLF